MMDNNRRKLLQLGAVGMPMMFTLRASAQSAVVSALQCTITIPDSWVILVDDSGAAWLGDMSWKKNDKLTTNKVQSLKDNSSFEFPAGAVDENFRPDGECEEDEDKDCGWGNDTNDPTGDNDDQASCKADPNRETSWFEEAGGSGEPGDNNSSGNGNSSDDGKGKGKGKGKDKDDSDSDGISCQYKVYSTGQSSEFPISEFVDENGNWNFEDVSGLYVSLAAQYAVQSSDTSGFPGVSCLVSVLNYLETNN